MDAYTGFAEVYDLFMDQVPYEKWSRRITEILKEYGIPDGLVLDLGCGTGSMTKTSGGRGLRHDRCGRFRGNAGAGL